MSPVKISPIGIAALLILLGAIVLYIQRRHYSPDNKELIAIKEQKQVEIVKMDQAGIKETVSMKELLSASIEIAARGGNQVKLVQTIALNEKSKGKTKEGANDPLTDGDIFSHKAMMQGFKQSFPGLNVISEEKGDSEKLNNELPPKKQNSQVNAIIKDDEDIPIKDITVWIDPLDATQEYTESLLEYVTTMVCVAVKGKPVIGVIHKPFISETAWAWVGHGHAGFEMPVKPDSDDPTRIIISRSHAGNVANMVKESFGEKAQVIPAGGAGYKVWSLFEGKADAYIHMTAIKKWDICAGNALLNHMGGQLTTLKGDSIDYSAAAGTPLNKDGLIAAVTGYEKFLKMIREHHQV